MLALMVPLLELLDKLFKIRARQSRSVDADCQTADDL